MNTRGATLTSRMAVLFAFLFAITACGGGGSGDNFYDGDDSGSTLQLALYDPQGNPTKTVTTAANGTLKVTVTGKGAGVVVTTTTDRGLIEPDTGAALTNDNGVATFIVKAGLLKGAGTLTSTANVDDEALTSTFGFQVGDSGLQLGYFDIDGDFIENEIAIEPDSTLASQGRATLSVAIVDENQQRVSTEEKVEFTSGCLSAGLATLSPASPITSVNGQVTTTYSAAGCEGIDEISASTASADGQAFGSVSIAAPEVTGLVFVRAEPTLIAVRGTGGASQRKESSDVTFKVVAGNGLPIQGVPVDFALTATGGGLSLSPASALSASDGTVIATVLAGDVTAVTRVIASTKIDGNTGQQVSTISDAVTVTSGLPSQGSVSLSVTGSVVEHGMTVDGIERTLTVRMSDAFNNPVANGTPAGFVTEYGLIDASCQTGRKNGDRLTGTPDEGECSVLWTSQNPRTPELDENEAAVQTIFNNAGYNCPSHNGNAGACLGDLGYTRGGRSTVRVTALGEESYVDTNGNGVMDPEEKNRFDNLPEAFLDKNEDGAYTLYLCDPDNGPIPSTAQCRAGSEESYEDLNLNGQYDLNNNPAVYNGLACPPEGDGVYCSRDLVQVRDEEVLILSAPDLDIGKIWDIILVRGSAVVDGTTEGDKYNAYISDLYNGRPPAGSTVTVSAGGGCEIISGTSFAIADSAAVGAATIAVGTGGDGEAGTVSITLQPANDGVPYTESFGCESNAPLDPNAPP